MADFETLTLCISLNSSQMRTYFCKGLVTGFQTDFITHNLLLWAWRHVKFVYRWISQMTYKPKSVGKMADFETLTFCISLNSSQMCIYLCKDLVRRNRFLGNFPGNLLKFTERIFHEFYWRNLFPHFPREILSFFWDCRESSQNSRK